MRKNLLIILVILCFSGCSEKKESSNSRYYKDVGDIPFDESIDDKEFKVCDEIHLKQYYVRGNSSDSRANYKGEKKAIKQAFLEQYQYPISDGNDGYFTIRFIVNCNGKSGRFRTEGMGFDYQPKTFSPEITSQLLQITKQLEGWVPRSNKQKVYDFYQYLTFKLEKGQIIHILP